MRRIIFRNSALKQHEEGGGREIEEGSGDIKRSRIRFAFPSP
jgi:hypothetical protein